MVIGSLMDGCGLAGGLLKAPSWVVMGSLLDGYRLACGGLWACLWRVVGSLVDGIGSFRMFFGHLVGGWL